MFVTGSSDILPLPPAVGKNDVNKNEASKQSFQSDPPVRVDAGVRYFSPVVRIDPESQQAIIIFREADGEVKRQYPSEKELEAYRSSDTATPNTDLGRKIAEVLPEIGGQGSEEPRPAQSTVIGTSSTKADSTGTSDNKPDAPDGGSDIIA